MLPIVAQILRGLPKALLQTSPAFSVKTAR